MAGSSDNMENVRDIGATSGARYSNATDRQKLGFGWPKPCIRTASLRTGVSVSGKRNFVRRDKGDETSGEVHRDSPAETKLTPQLGQLRASYRTAGKSLRKSECVVADAVTVEPVSAKNFPGIREKYREKIGGGTNPASVGGAVHALKSGTLEEIA
jgi:hypothetical protein